MGAHEGERIVERSEDVHFEAMWGTHGPVAEVYRTVGISQPIYFGRKKKYAVDLPDEMLTRGLEGPKGQVKLLVG